MKAKYTILITADHGNAEQMWDDATSGPFTAHTTNEVPLALIGDAHRRTLRKGGRLADLAPTVLELMDLHKPKEMTGDSPVAVMSSFFRNPWLIAGLALLIGPGASSLFYRRNPGRWGNHSGQTVLLQ